MTDGTEGRETDAALRASQHRLSLAQLAGRVGMFDWDLRTNDSYWTPELKALYGEPILPTVAETWFTRVHPADLEEATDAIQEGMDSGAIDVEYRVRWPDGTIRSLHLHGSSLRDESGKFVRMLGAVVDVTDRKRLENERNQALKMEALGRLAGGVAHDFNNLLTVIASYGSLLADGPSSREEFDGDVREILRAAERGAMLTKQLLAFSREEDVQPERLLLDAEVAEVSAMLERLIGRAVRLRVELGCEGAAIHIGRGKLPQILMNLAINARDAMPSGGELQIATRTERDKLALIVSDTGEGMPESVRAHVFEPFFTTKGSGDGTGLGLATVFGIVQQAGGTIRVDSFEGQGSSFTIHFPLAH